jgi:hypothetical protein
VNAATTWLLYRLARRLAGERAALVAAAAFAVLSLDRWIMGVFAHATQFVILPVVAGLLLLERASASRRLGFLVAAGVLLGLAVLMKQHAVAFVAFALAILLWRDLEIDRTPLGAALRRSGALALGAAAPLAIVCALLVAQGLFGRFWLWTVRYAGAYVSEVPWSGALPALVAGIHSVTIATWALWLVAGIGLAGMWLAPWRRETRVYVLGFLLAAFVTVCPGFYFRAHYFIAMLPAVALLVGVAIVSLERRAAKALGPAAAAAAAVAAFLAAILSYVATEHAYLFTMSPDDVSRERYGRNLFVEAPAIGRFIQARTAAGDQVAVIGSEPEIYFYANRRSATGYVYMYPLMEPQPFAARMQDELIREGRGRASGDDRVRRVAHIMGTAPRIRSPRPRVGGPLPKAVLRRRRRHRTPAGWHLREPLGRGGSGSSAPERNVVYTLKRRSNTHCSVEPSSPP